MDIALIIILILASLVFLIIACTCIFDSCFCVKEKVKMSIPFLLCASALTFVIYHHTNPPVIKTETYSLQTINDERNFKYQMSNKINVTQMFGMYFPEESKLKIETCGGWNYCIYFCQSYRYSVYVDDKKPETVYVNNSGSFPEK